MITIGNKQAYHEAMAEIESYLTKGLANLSEAEDLRLDELSIAVEAWEEKAYPIPKPDFKAILMYVMQQNNFNQTQLADELHVSKSLLSGLLKGKKEPNIGVLKSMHTLYNLDGNLLLESL